MIHYGKKDGTVIGHKYNEGFVQWLKFGLGWTRSGFEFS